MAETTDVSTTVSLSNPDSLCCCDTFYLTNKRICKGERKIGTAFAASLAIHNTKSCVSSCTVWLFVSDSVHLFVFLMQTQCVFMKWKITPQIPIRSQENEMDRTGSTYGGQ